VFGNVLVEGIVLRVMIFFRVKPYDLCSGDDSICAPFLLAGVAYEEAGVVLVVTVFLF
jgi:hypothetical protein